jgi:hypothetical protein
MQSLFRRQMQVSDHLNFPAFFPSVKETRIVSCLNMTLGAPQSHPGRSDGKFLPMREFKLIFKDKHKCFSKM